MKRKTVVLLFVLGSCMGIPLAVLYVLFSPSGDKYFHAFVMLAACCVSFPAVVVFLRITLQMWEMAQDQREVLREVKDEIKPISEKTGAVVDKIEKMIHDDGEIDSAMKAIKDIPKKLDEIVRSEKKNLIDNI